jgi:hypothetical protein
MFSGIARREWSDRRVAAVLAILTLFKGLFWIALFPAFKIADEPSHFENVAYRAEYFRAPQAEAGEPLGAIIHIGSPKDVLIAWARTNQLFRSGYVAGIREVREEKDLRDMARDPANRRGTGHMTSRDYRGFYYNVAVPLYELFRQNSVLARVAAVRCVSLLFGIIAVLATFFAARLVMDSRPLAAAAAMIVMLQPMESQMVAAVNNDAGVIGLAAALLYLQLRFLVRAPQIPHWREGVLMGALVGCIIFTKPHGFGMLPGCAIACGYVVAKNRRSPRAWKFAGAAAACAGLFLILYVWPTWSRGAALVPGTAPAADAVLPRGAFPDYLSFLDGMGTTYQDYLFRSFFGQFGWLEYSLGPLWLQSITLLWRLVELGAVAAIAVRVVRGPSPTSWLSMKGFLFSGFTALFAVGFILYAEYRLRLVGLIGVVQGRSFLFALPAMAIAAAASYGALVPSRFRTLSAAALATSAAGLHAGSILLIFRYHYGT